MTLDIDGKKVEEPDDTAVENGFESIDKTTGFRNAGLSLAILSRNEKNSLAVIGHPIEGWRGLVLEVNGISSTADISGTLRQRKIIQIFQSYSRGDKLWEKEFQWHVIDEGKWPVKGILILVMVFVVILFFIRSCVK